MTLQCLVNCVTCETDVSDITLPCPIFCPDGDKACSKGVVHYLSATFRAKPTSSVIERWDVFGWEIPAEPDTCELDTLQYIANHYEKRGNKWLVTHTESFRCDWSDTYHRYFPVVGNSCFDIDGLNAWEYLQYYLDVDPIWMRTHECPGNMIHDENGNCVCPPGFVEVNNYPCCDDDDIPPPPPGTPPPPPPPGFTFDPSIDSYRPLNNGAFYKYCTNIDILLEDCSNSLEKNGAGARRIRPSAIMRKGSWPQYGTPKGVLVTSCLGGVILPDVWLSYNDLDLPDSVWMQGDYSYTCTDSGEPADRCGPRWVGYWAHPSVDGNPYKWKFSFTGFSSCEGPKGPGTPWIPISPPVEV